MNEDITRDSGGESKETLKNATEDATNIFTISLW